ncbi:hypothetical protein [Ekhidna sp.]|uniref:hypothetical protein n=1 Tax=Ekhidna sp. TaxID=2608089 RepID=UPI00351440F7
MDNFKLSSEQAELKIANNSFSKSIPLFKWLRGILLLVAGVGISCSESRKADPSTLGYDFYPLNIGQYRIYDVEEIKYLVSGFDTTVFQLRETIFDSISSIDQTVYLLRRDIRADDTAPWKSDSVWSVTSTSNYLSISENNIPYIKLTFPVKEGRDWDANSLNSKDPSTSYYQSMSNSIIDSVGTESHMRVIIEDIEENVTGVDLRSEVYARGIGLVEKDYLVQKKCTSSDCGGDLGEVIAGRSLKQVLIEIGNEE